MSSFSQPGRNRTLTHLGMSKHDLERDSGFSDTSSEYLSAVDLTDSESMGRNGSIMGQEPAGPQMAVMGGSYAGMSPMIIMNNFVLKQPSSMAPAEKQWGFPSPMEVMPPSQVVLLQPMVPNGNSGTPKTLPDNTRHSKAYMPILKSYPRIAPHPVDTPTKRAGSSKVRSSSGYEQRQRRRRHGHSRPHGSQSSQPTLQSTGSLEAATIQPQPAESPETLTEKSLSALVGVGSLTSDPEDLRMAMDSDEMFGDCDQDIISMHSNKLQRFSNTYNILNQSGLLGITMRTKQLIKDNKRTQGQLQELREQTALLLEALSSGDPQLWTKLQLTLQDTQQEQWVPKAQSILA